MKESKIVTFEIHDIEKIFTAVCKKKFPGLEISRIDVSIEEGGLIVVGFEEFDPERKEDTSNEN